MALGSYSVNSVEWEQDHCTQSQGGSVVTYFWVNGVEKKN